MEGMNATLGIARIARSLTGNFIFRKKLPATFGNAQMNVTSRSDIRLLAPGLRRSNADLLQVASLYIKPGSCVWDIGSNVGVFSFCASWKAGSQGSVYSLEADPFYVELQNKTVRSLPAGYSAVIPLCAAVADTVGIVGLCIPRRGCSRNHLASVGGNNAGETEAIKQVVTLTADFLLKYWPKPDFVKVDIEGAEILFLHGAKELLETVRPTMYIEVCESNSNMATELLSSFNYRTFTLAADGSEQPTEKCQFNCIAKPTERL